MKGENYCFIIKRAEILIKFRLFRSSMHAKRNVAPKKLEWWTTSGVEGDVGRSIGVNKVQ